MIKTKSKWWQNLLLSTIVLGLGVFLWSLANMGQNKDAPVLIEDSTRRHVRRSDTTGRGGQSRSLSYLLETVTRIEVRLYDVGDSRFDDTLIWNFVDGLSLSEAEALSQNFVLKSNPGSRPWKIALITRWSELDPIGAANYLETEIERLEELDDSRVMFVATLKPVLALGQARVDLDSVWNSVRDGDDKTRELLLKYLASRAPEDGFSLLELSQETTNFEGDWNHFLENLPQNSNWLDYAVRLKERGMFKTQDDQAASKKIDEFGLGDRGRVLTSKLTPVSVFFSKWATNDSRSALDWFTQNVQSKEGLFGMIRAWGKVEPKAVIEWAKNESTGVKREFVFEAIRGNLQTNTDAKLWISLSQYLPDQDERFEILKEVAFPIGLIDSFNSPVSAYDLKLIVSQSDLSEAQERELLEILGSAN